LGELWLDFCIRNCLISTVYDHKSKIAGNLLGIHHRICMVGIVPISSCSVFLWRYPPTGALLLNNGIYEQPLICFISSPSGFGYCLKKNCCINQWLDNAAFW